MLRNPRHLFTLLCTLGLAACHPQAPASKPDAARPDVALVPEAPVVTEAHAAPVAPATPEAAAPSTAGESAPLGAQGYQVRGCSAVAADSLYEKCLKLQNEALNQDCGMFQRLQLFSEVCEPQGFTWMESYACEISKLKLEAPIQFGSAPEDKMESHTYCLGRSESAQTSVGHFEFSGKLDDRAGLSLKMNYVHARENLDQRSSNYDIAVTDAQGAEIVSLRSESTSGFHGATGVSKDGQSRYGIDCAPTWGCPAKR